jgi:DNA-binding IclR family transcriptional regulator
MGDRDGEADVTNYEQRIIRLLKREGVPLRPFEIASWTFLSPGIVRRSLQSLSDRGAVSRNDNGYWGLT